jgi:uncharacterized protein (DUF2141 family)
MTGNRAVRWLALAGLSLALAGCQQLLDLIGMGGITIDGHVTVDASARSSTGTLRVQVLSSISGRSGTVASDFSQSYAGQSSLQYSITIDNAGDYELIAFIDTDGDGVWGATEPGGLWQTNSGGDPILTAINDSLTIDVTVTVSGSGGGGGGGSTSLSVPTGLAVDGATSNSLHVSWNSVSGAGTYQVYRDTSAGGTFAANVYDGSSTAFTDSGLAASTTYYYKVRATDGQGSTSLSTAASGATTASGSSTVTLTPTADASFESFNPDTASGTDTELRVEGALSGSHSHGIMTFNLGPMQGTTIDSAVLTVTALVSTNATVVVFQAANYSYNEALSTYNSVALNTGTNLEGPTATLSIPGSTTGSFTVDLTTVIQYAVTHTGITGIAMYTNNASYQAFLGSKDNATAGNRPSLDLTYHN